MDGRRDGRGRRRGSCTSALLACVWTLAFGCGGSNEARVEPRPPERSAPAPSPASVDADRPRPSVEQARPIDVARPCFPDGACFRFLEQRGLRAIDAAPGLMVEVGGRGAVVETVGGVRAVVPAFTTFDLTDVWARDAVEAWAVGDRVYRRSARGWAAVDCGDARWFVAVHGDCASGRVVAITNRSLVRIDGDRCESVSVDPWLRDVWVEPGGRRAWAVGGARVSWADGAPVIEAGGGGFVAGRAPDDVWITSDRSTLRFDGRAWRRADEPDLSGVRIEPAVVDGELVVIAANGLLRDARGWRSSATIRSRPPEWELALDVATDGTRWIAETGSVHTVPAPDEASWVDAPGEERIRALASTPDATWIANDVLHRVDERGIRSWDPFRHFFWRANEAQCQLARVTGVVGDGARGVLAAAQAREGCPPVASLFRIDDEPAIREEHPLPYPIRNLVLLPGGTVLGIGIEHGDPPLLVDPRGRVRRVRLPGVRRDEDAQRFEPSACAARDGRAWIVDDRLQLYRLDRGATSAVRVAVAAGAESVFCDAEGAWVIGCNGRLARCDGRRCAEIPQEGESIGGPCTEPRFDDSPLAGTGPFHPLARDPEGRFFTGIGPRILVRAALDAPWQQLDVHDRVADLAFRPGYLVVLYENGDLAEHALAALPLVPLGTLH